MQKLFYLVTLALLTMCAAGCKTVPVFETKVTLDIGINEHHEKDRVTISIGAKY